MGFEIELKKLRILNVDLFWIEKNERKKNIKGIKKMKKLKSVTNRYSLFLDLFSLGKLFYRQFYIAIQFFHEIE